jgi:hypothetical protein
MKGQEKGIALGKEKWFGLGIEKGKTDIARKMIVEGISLDIICKTTGLSRSEVESLEVEQPMH